MTVAYADTVAQSGTWYYFKLLLRWKASLWKAIWGELLLWLIIYTLISLIYRLNILNDTQKTSFEKVVQFCSQYTGDDFVPLTFILGFFVSLVVSRWWNMFSCIGQTECVAALLKLYIDGNDEEIMIMKRNIVRYMVLTQAMILQTLSFSLRKVYPDLESLKHAGLINEVELQTMESVETPNPKHWLPIYWAMSLIKEAKKNERIANNGYVINLYAKLRDFRDNLGKMANYMTVPIPLAYMQVVFLAVRLYFAIALVGTQYLDPSRVKSSTSDVSIQFGIDLYFPFGTVIQFFFYVGWVKVAESLFNPFGGDDDDFEINTILINNLRNGLTIVDEDFGKTPEQIRDPFSISGNDAPLVPEKGNDGFFQISITKAFRRRSTKVQNGKHRQPLEELANYRIYDQAQRAFRKIIIIEKVQQSSAVTRVVARDDIPRPESSDHHNPRNY